MFQTEGVATQRPCGRSAPASSTGGRKCGDGLERVRRRGDERECVGSSGEHLLGFWLRVRWKAVGGFRDEQ